jgi:hypothetical protein
VPLVAFTVAGRAAKMAPTMDELNDELKATSADTLEAGFYKIANQI